METEVWREYQNEKLKHPLYVSNLGRLKNEKGRILKTSKPVKLTNGYLSKIGIKRQTKNGKATNLYVHNIVAETFISKRWEFQKKVCFIDGNFENLNAKNLYYQNTTGENRKEKINGIWKRRIVPKSERKIRNEFPETLEAKLLMIAENTTKYNLEDTHYIIMYLNGCENSMGKLFEKYNKLWVFCIRKYCIRRCIKKKKHHQATTLEDIIQDAFIHILDKVKTGRFDGKNFKKWSKIVVMNFFLKYLLKSNEEDVFVRNR